MLWKKGRRSDNVVDARSDRSGMRVGGKGLTLGGVALIVVFGLITGQDPLQILGQITGQLGQQSAPLSPQSQSTLPTNDPQTEFVR
ncbi:neutral zinc metallopeptidase, partial [Pandoraea sputorum]|uniref:neutral zinc metallopeptidase n=2 Tax=Pseudomonadota TaxID=1224 RepID=UPI00355752B6